MPGALQPPTFRVSFIDMKSVAAPTEARAPRPYRQTTRAEAAAATGRRIVEAFLALARDGWLDDITLDAVARDAGATVQTVIRRFGGKDGLIAAAAEQLDREIAARRNVPPGAVEQALAALVADYELTGDLVIRLLAQEPRHPALRAPLDRGRAGHRAWLAAVFAPRLAGFAQQARERRLDALVVATDVYAWKLLRRDMGHGAAEVAALMRNLVAGALAPTDDAAGPR
jgi:AcrR family transcriptional regulator